MDRIRADPARLQSEEVARDRALIIAQANPTAEEAYRKVSVDTWMDVNGAEAVAAVEQRQARQAGRWEVEAL